MKRNIMKTLLAALLIMALLAPMAMMEEAPAGGSVATEIGIQNEDVSEDVPEDVPDDVPVETPVDTPAEHDETPEEPEDDVDVEELIIAKAFEDAVSEEVEMYLDDDGSSEENLSTTEGLEDANENYGEDDADLIAEAQLFAGDSDFIIENGILKQYNGTDAVVTIPDGVTIIGEGAFHWNDTLTEVKIPNTVTVIDKNAFWDCSNLTKVNIPNSVTMIESWAFMDCNLQNVTIPKSVKTIGSLAFDGNAGMETVTIENGVENIGYLAFRDCKKLTEVTVPQSVKDWNGGLFDGCTGLVNVTLPIPTISGPMLGGFNGCTNLECVTFYGQTATPGVINIPNGFYSIRSQAFKSCGKLTAVMIPESVRYIYDEAFYQCVNLASVTIGAPKNPDTWYNGVEIYDKAFLACSSSIVFHTQCDTAATKWAREHGYTVDACEHGRETVAGKPSTCMQTGLSDYDRCPYCYTEFTTQKELPLAPHTPVVVEGYAPTEFGKGKTNGSRCSVCYVTLQDRQDIPPLCESAPVVNAARGGKATVNAGQLFRLDMGGQAYKNLRVTGVNASWTTRNDGNIYMTISSGKKAKITFKVGKKKRTLTLTVNDPTIPTSVTLSAPTTVVKKGDTVTLTPVVPDGTNPGGFKWKSSNKKVATVKNGVVKFKKPGKVTITCTAKRGKKKAKIRFTVGK